MFLFDAINITLVGVISIYILFALFIIMNGRSSKISVSYLSVVLSAIAWTMAMFFYRSADQANANFWGVVVYVTATFPASSFYVFSLVFPHRRNLSSVKLAVAAALNLLAILLAGYPGAAIREVIAVPGGEKAIIWGPLYYLYFLYIAGLFSAGFFNLFKNYNNETGVTKLQLRYAFWGYFLGSLLAIYTNFLLPWLGIFSFNWIGQVFSVFMVAFTAYAIIRYRLMGIRLIGSKIFSYLLIACFTYTFFYFVLLVEEGLLGGLYSKAALALGPVFALIFSALFVPFFKKVQKSSDIIFYSGYHPRSIIKNLGLRLGEVIDLGELVKTLSFEFKKILETEHIDVYYLGERRKDSKTYAVSLAHPARTLARDSLIAKNISRNKAIIVRHEAEREGHLGLSRELEKLKASIIAPLITRNRVIGLIAVGEKISGEAYTLEDFEFLEIISAQAATAIENAHLYQKVEDFNKTLRQKVEEQTRDIKEKSERLAKLVEMRSDFLDITSHQLRTPVSVIKGVLSMLDEGSIPKEKVKDFVKGAFDKSIILSEIINDILRASEMDSDRFELKPKPMQLEPLLEKIREDKTKLAEIKNIKLRLILPGRSLPPVMSDEKYMEQAIGNLLDNAFQYTLSGGAVTVSAEEKNGRVIVRVADTGIGIPPADVPKLFHKFGRGNNALSAYADGSGLGLYIVRKIVSAHPGGKAEIERTEVGKGTTFAISLPALDFSPAKPLPKKISEVKV